MGTYAPLVAPGQVVQQGCLTIAPEKRHDILGAPGLSCAQEIMAFNRTKSLPDIMGNKWLIIRRKN
jgi:hypothetical protein